MVSPLNIIKSGDPNHCFSCKKKLTKGRCTNRNCEANKSRRPVDTGQQSGFWKAIVDFLHEIGF